MHHSDKLPAWNLYRRGLPSDALQVVSLKQYDEAEKGTTLKATRLSTETIGTAVDQMNALKEATVNFDH